MQVAGVLDIRISDSESRALEDPMGSTIQGLRSHRLHELLSSSCRHRQIRARALSFTGAHLCGGAAARFVVLLFDWTPYNVRQAYVTEHFW